jgi:RNA polymerase sigma factor (TIGR02999 family)
MGQYENPPPRSTKQTAAENVTEKLLPLIYDELRRLAAHQMAGQRPGQTLQATALVHEAYLRLVGQDEPGRQHWDGRGHFFAAAAQAMRRILIDRARQKQSLKRGGDQARTTWDESKVGDAAAPEEILAVDEALTKLSQEDPDLAKIVNLRYFAGMTVPETAAPWGLAQHGRSQNGPAPAPGCSERSRKVTAGEEFFGRTHGGADDRLHAFSSLVPDARGGRPVADLSHAATTSGVPATINTSLVATLGSKVENPIRALDDVEMMFDHQDRVPCLHQPLQTIQQTLDIGEMQAGRGFVENVEVVAAAAHFAQLGRQFDPLRLAPGKDGGGMA